MTTNAFFPGLSNLLNVENIPSILISNKKFNSIFHQPHYSNLLFSKSMNGSSYYSLKLISKNKIELEIPGTSLKLILNPNIVDENTSTFEININWQLLILKYISKFKSNNLPVSIEEVFTLILNLLKIDENLLLKVSIGK